MPRPEELAGDAQIYDFLAHRDGMAGDHVKPNQAGLSGGGGGGTFDPMEPRVAALEEGMKDIKTALKEIRDGQHAAALKAAEQVGVVNTKFSEMDGKFTEVNGKLTTITEVNVGLRRDLEKLPTEYGVAKIFVFVIGGLGAIAALLKTGWPLLSKIWGP